MLEAKKDYKYYCRSCKLKYSYEQGRKMKEMRKKQPREFWKMFKYKKQTPTESEISIEEFYQYFKSLSNQDPPFVNMEADNLIHNLDTYRTGSTFQELGSPITQEEIKNASKQFNSNRACSLDTILKEYLKESVFIISAFRNSF